jgi:hypothetical protein
LQPEELGVRAIFLPSAGFIAPCGHGTRGRGRQSSALLLATSPYAAKDEQDEHSLAHRVAGACAVAQPGSVGRREPGVAVAVGPLALRQAEAQGPLAGSVILGAPVQAVAGLAIGTGDRPAADRWLAACIIATAA